MILLAMLLGLGLAQESDDAESTPVDDAESTAVDDAEDTAVDDSKETEEESTPEVQNLETMKEELEDKPRTIIEKSLPEVIVDPESDEDGPIIDEDETDSEEDGVIGQPDQLPAWQRVLQTEEDFGLIFRPQLGLTTLQTIDSSYSGLHMGLHLGYQEAHRLRFVDIGVYSRSRILFLPTFGDLDGSELRIGSVGGVNLSALELEAGADLIRHRIGVSGTDVDYEAAIGFAIPVQALVNFDGFKIKAEVEPRWYLSGARQPVVWEEQAELMVLPDDLESELVDLPVRTLGDEFSWAVGARIGVFALSYEQLHMKGAVQRVISWGLQR